MNSIINALIWSSANPDKVSLSIRAGVPFIITLLTLLNIHVDINPFIDQLILVVNAALVLVTGAITLYGLGRKLWLTLTGQNQSLQ